MKKTKKILSLFMAVILIAGLTGCVKINAVIDTTESWKEYTMQATVYYDKEAIDSLSVESKKDTSQSGWAAGKATKKAKKLPVVTVNGKKYYVRKSKIKKYPYNDIDPHKGMIVTDASFYTTETLKHSKSNEAEDALLAGMIEEISFKVIFDSKIVKTNGKLSQDKRTVVFTYKFKGNHLSKKNPMGEMYAYTDRAEHTLASDRKMMKAYNKKKDAYLRKKAKNANKQN